jgi:site-specific DNA-methyltransferase (adenine-specific)
LIAEKRKRDEEAARREEEAALAEYDAEGWHLGQWQDHIGKLDDGSVKVLLTDPPYGMGYQSDWRLDRTKPHKHDKIEGDDADAAAVVGEMAEAFLSKLADDAHVFVFCGWRNEPEMRAALEQAGLTIRGSLIWDKQATGMGDPTTTFAPAHERILHAVKGSPPLYRRAADVLRYTRADSSRHPTEKPTPLLVELIETTTVPGELVADPFGGVASTAVAATSTDRRRWSVELDEGYHETGVDRLRALDLDGGEAAAA